MTKVIFQDFSGSNRGIELSEHAMDRNRWRKQIRYVDCRDLPKVGFSTENNNLNCFGKFRFRPNIDLWLSAKIRFRPKKFRGFGRVPKVHTAVGLTLYIVKW